MKEDVALPNAPATTRVGIPQIATMLLALGLGRLGIADGPQQNEAPADRASERVDNSKMSKPILVTLEKFREAKNARYSEDYVIEFMDKIGSLGNSDRRIPREKEGMQDHDYFSIRIFVRKRDAGYMRHGTNSKLAEWEAAIPDMGIPLDADPQAIVIFPGATQGDQEIVRQYPLKERC